METTDENLKLIILLRYGNYTVTRIARSQANQIYEGLSKLVTHPSEETRWYSLQSNDGCLLAVDTTQVSGFYTFPWTPDSQGEMLKNQAEAVRMLKKSLGEGEEWRSEGTTDVTPN